ncbi:MAG: DUF6768 family protein, partial [Pseudomonadota bacterium]
VDSRGVIREPNFYREVWDSFHGRNASLLITTWVGILVASAGLIYCVVKMFQVTETNELILFASFAVMLNSGQIALKLWYNMRLNRAAMLTEIRKLRLALVSEE